MLKVAVSAAVPLLLAPVVVSSITALAIGSSRPPDDDCPEGTHWTGQWCVPDEDDQDEPPPRTGCSQADPTVLNAPCQIAGFRFHQPVDRYLRPLDESAIEVYRPGGPYADVWENYPQGWIYEWRKLSGFVPPVLVVWGDVGHMWMAESPFSLPPVDPEVLAEQVLDDMALEPVDIGLAPTPVDADPDALGLVGAPVWMWAANPTARTWGPITDSASERGVTVTVTAAVEEAEWNMGDGKTQTCSEPGTPYRQQMGVRPSPTCGHTYEHTSRDQPDDAFTVTATTHWAASWEASTGETGTLAVEPLTSTARVRIGERQLIEQEAG